MEELNTKYGHITKGSSLYVEGIIEYNGKERYISSCGRLVDIGEEKSTVFITQEGSELEIRNEYIFPF